jgi:polar amino acid transport system substrate-binding protein
MMSLPYTHPPQSPLYRLSGLRQDKGGGKFFFALLLGLLVMLVGEHVTAATLAEIQQRGQLTVAVKDNWVPLGFRDGSGQLQGFEIAIARQLAQDLLGSAQKVVLKPTKNTERLTAVTSGTVDLAIANLTITENRQRLVMFSDPYYRSGTGILTTNPRLNRLWRLSRQAIAVLDASVTFPYLRSFLPKAQLRGASSYQSALELLHTRQVQAIVADQIVLSVQAKQSGYYFYPTKLTLQPLAIALPKGVQHESLRAAINDRLARWHQSGWLQNQQKIWGLP